MDGGTEEKENFVFFVLSSTSSVIIRSADEWNMNCDWHVSTQTLDGGIQHHSQVGRDKKKSIGRGGRRRLIKKWPRAEIDGDDTLVNTSHIFPSPVQK
jgi:hypothetical protein